MWEHPYTDCVCPCLGGRAGFDVDSSYIFPQGVLAAITLEGVELKMEGLELALGEAGLPLCLVAITILSGVWSDPKLLEPKDLRASLSWLCSL